MYTEQCDKVWSFQPFSLESQLDLPEQCHRDRVLMGFL